MTQLAPARPAPAPAGRARRMLAPMAALAGVGVAWAAVTAWSPGDDGVILCPFRLITGLDCPLCGSTRAAAELAHGNLVAALDHNAFFVLVVLPLSVLAWSWWAVAAWRGRPFPQIPTRLLQALLVLLAAWWILRLAVPWLGSGSA